MRRMGIACRFFPPGLTAGLFRIRVM